MTYYLFFCTIAIAWLSFGMVYSVQSVLMSRIENRCLSVLGQAAAEIEMDYLRKETETVGSVLEKLQSQNQLQYAAVEGLDGTYQSHTNPAMVGRQALLPNGTQYQWGDVSATRYSISDAQPVLAMQVPLKIQDDEIGTLWIATSVPDFLSTAKASAKVAPITMLVPLAVIGAGAFLLRRVTLPISQVEEQLEKLSHLPPNAIPKFEKLPSQNSINVGWNHLVDALERFQRNCSKPSVTDRVTAAIRERKGRDSLDVLDHLSEGLAITDATGRIQFANRAIDALLGETSGTGMAKGTAIEEYLSGNIDQPEELLALLEGSPERPARMEVTRSCGERKRILRVERQPVAQGEEGHVWSVRDVTQQKMADDMRGQFIDSATHELRTPLANIKAYSETLAMMDDVDVEMQKEFCNTINNEATRLARFVDDLLSVSSMEVGSLSIHRQNVNLERLFDEVVDKIKPLTNKKSQELGIDLPEKLGEAHLDKDKMSAMLVNLLGNASKYTAEGGRVGLIVTAAQGFLTINIEDSGVGISAEELPNVFDKFFRSKDPRVQSEVGTGLGLTMANEIVKLHGGEITVKSTKDVGTTFTVTLPLMQEARL